MVAMGASSRKGFSANAPTRQICALCAMRVRRMLAYDLLREET
jgi:hypothetical protein